MKSLLIALALLVAAPVAVAAEEAPVSGCITFDALGFPATAEKVVLTDTEMARVREFSAQAGHEVSTDVAEMTAVFGPLTETVLIVGLTAEHCVNGAAVVSARSWVAIHGEES